MDDKLIRLARKVKTLEDELSKITQIKDLEGLLVASNDMNSRYKKSINETVGMYKEYISNTKKELTDSFEAIKKDYDSKKDSYKKNMNNLEAKINKVKDDIQKVCTSIDKSIEDIQKDILKDIKDKNTQILNEIGKKDKELKEVKNESASLVKDLKALKDLVNKLELQKGDDGKSAYDIACELGFKGTKEEWIKSLHGKDGQDIELRGLRAFSDVKNDNKMYARKNKKWVEVENYDDTEIREDIAELQEENEAQTEQIQALQTENTRLKATLPTTTGSGENITLSKTAEMEFIQPPLPRGNSEQATSILPTGYTQLDYIENSGTQYIDTGFIPNYDKNIKIKIEAMPTISNGRYCALTNYDAFNHLTLEFNNNQERLYYNNGQIDRFVGTISTSEKNTIIFNYDTTNKQYNLSVNDVSVNGNMNATGESDSSMLIFVDLQKRFSTFPNPLQMYSLKIWEDDILIKDFVPCKNASNEVGLYDLVSETFFANEGTGTFTAGDVATLPNPDFEVPIQNVTGDVEVLVQNKNLAKLDWASKFVTAVNNTNNAKLETKDNKSCVWFKPSVGYNFYDTQNFSLDIKFKPNTQYTVSFDLLKTDANNKTVAIYYTDGTYTSNSNATALNTWEHQSITSTAGKTIAYIAPFYTSGNTYIDINSWQVEENTTATTYVAHAEQTYTFPLGTQRMYLGDYLADDGIHHVRGVMTFDGSNDESWDIQSNAYFRSGSIQDIATSTSNSKCTIATITTLSSLSSSDVNKYAVGGTRLWFRCPQFETLANWKAYLAENPITVEYELATEEITPYTTEQQQAYDEIKQAISYEEQTNISGSSDESNPLFSVEAYQSIKLVLAG